MKSLRPYQKKLIRELKKSLSRGNKNVLVQSPAGSGKSVTMAEIAKSATDKNNRVLFVVHRRELVNQIKATFKSQGVDLNLCEIAMVQTVSRRLDKTKTPRIILVDEAHHSLARTYRKIFDNFPKANVIGFTATPWRLSGAGFTDVFDDLVLGPEIQWLISKNFLAPYHYYSINLIDHSKLKKSRTGDYTADSMEEASINIYGDIVENYVKFAKNKKTIIYAFSVKFSQTVADKFNRAGYPAKAVDGKTPKEIRAQAMQDFIDGKIKILVNADLYGEGVDVPDCECVIMLRPTESLSLFIQQSMRCMRYYPNKTAIILDLVANYKTHGLPDDKRDWSLEGVKKRDKKPSDAIGIKQCPECFAVIHSAVSICPHCGHSFEADYKRKVEMHEAELEEIKHQPLKINMILAKKPSELKTLADLKAYGKAKGYNPKWAYVQAKIKHIF